MCKLYLKTVFSIKEKAAAPLTSHLPLILYYSQKMSAVHRPTYCYFHSQNTEPVTQLLGWNKIYLLHPPPFFFHLVLNDLQKKTTRSVSLILGSSCRLVFNRSTHSSSQWTCLELQFCFEMKSLITDSFSKGVVY